MSDIRIIADRADIVSIAEAIRSKTGKSAGLTLAQMPNEIASIVGGGSGTCGGTHIIEVTELPTENVSEDAVYSCNDAFYKGTYFKELSDILMVSNGISSSMKSQAAAAGLTFSLNIITTKTTENVIISDLKNTYHVYYVEDEDKAFFYTADGWVIVSDAFNTTYNGTVKDNSEVTVDGIYAVVSSGYKWKTYFSGKQVIEVEELPTENINEEAVYFCDNKYQVYGSEFLDLVMVLGSGYGAISFKEIFSSEGGICNFIIIPTRISDGILESTDTELNIYYILDENIVSVYQGGQWENIPVNGVVSDISEVPTDVAGYYVIGGVGWKTYCIPSGSLSITENGTHDVAEVSKVSVNVPPPEGYIKPSGTITLKENGEYNVKSYETATVNVVVPSACIVQTLADLPTNANNGSLAIVLGGM